MNLLAIHYGHNASLSISSNGKIIYTISEERYNQLKNFFGFPEISLKRSLNFINKNNIKIDYILFIDQYGSTLEYILKKKFKTHPLIKPKRKDKYHLYKYLAYKLFPIKLLNLIPIIKQNIRKKKFKSTKSK